MSVEVFCTVTPWRVASCGSLGMARLTRFWMSTAAMSRSVPISNVAVVVNWPSLVHCDE